MRTIAATCLLTALLSGLPPAALAQTRPAPVRVDTPAPALVDDQTARQTRDRLREILDQYPPSVAQVLRLDPSLITRPDYVAPYPVLASFLAQHPDVAHNPTFFFGEARFASSETPRNQAARVVESVFTEAFVLIGFISFFTLVGWMTRAVIEHRAWLRASKTQTEVHTKLVDRLTSNEDLLAYLESPTGRRLLGTTSGPSVEIGTRPVTAPVSRILWSVQAGVVLAAAGVGLWFAKNNVIEEASQPLYVVATLAIALGVGFVISAVLSYGISRQLGLLETRSTHA